MLQVEDLTVRAQGQEILSRINLSIPPGEVHVVLGPNGSGKTTLLRAIMGMGGLEIVGGRILFQGHDITFLPVDERARLGVGIAMQRIPAIPELTLETVLDLVHPDGGQVCDLEEVESLQCRYLLQRPFNTSFSGGEMKRAELLQLLVQQPELVLVDEPESGVDIENIGVVGRALRDLLKADREIEKRRSALIITHTGHILDYLNADHGYIFLRGEIACRGNPRDLFEEINQHGFERCAECPRCL